MTRKVPNTKRFGCVFLASAFLIASSCVSAAPPPAVTCNNSALDAYDELLIVAPHPDDEILGFTGLSLDFRSKNKPVSVVVVSIGDGYCDACSFWKNVGSVPSMTQWAQCTESDLAAFAAVRKDETRSAQQILGGKPPTFWEYPDTGSAVAWAAVKSGVGMDTSMKRSDCTKEGVFGTGSKIGLSPRTMYAQLSELIAKASPRTLIATTHPLDGHMDHIGLGNMIRRVNAELAASKNPTTRLKSVVFTVIHANSTPAGVHDADAWYPYPAAVDGACFDQSKQARYLEDPILLSTMRNHRYQPEWSHPLPEDAPYLAAIPNGKAVAFCLPPAVYQGKKASKLLAVGKFISQQGFLARTGAIPHGMAGLVDCNGYQMGFIRANEMFVLEAQD